MKRKIIFSLILTVSLLTVGSVCAASAQVQNSCSDLADPDYEMHFTEEELAINELSNKQNYKRIAENLKPYEVYGLSYDSEINQLYFNDVPACYFEDNRATDGTFEGTQLYSKDGEIGIIAQRDETGNLTGLKQLNSQELSDHLSKGWKKRW